MNGLDMKGMAKEIKDEFRQSSRMLLESFGFEQDPEIRFYKKLSEQDFAAASSVFGLNRVIDYIKEMEARQLRRRVE